MIALVAKALAPRPAPEATPRELRRAVERREFLRRLRPVRMAAVVVAAAVTLEAPRR